jgi:hypothetical protein
MVIGVTWSATTVPSPTMAPVSPVGIAMNRYQPSGRSVSSAVPSSVQASRRKLLIASAQ